MELLIDPVAVEASEIVTAADAIDADTITLPSITPNRRARRRLQKQARRSDRTDADRDTGGMDSTSLPAPADSGTDFLVTPVTAIEAEPATPAPLDAAAAAPAAPTASEAAPEPVAEAGPALLAGRPETETETAEETDHKISRRQRRRAAKAARPADAETSTPETVGDAPRADLSVAPPEGVAITDRRSRDTDTHDTIHPTIDIGEEMAFEPGPFRPAIDLTIEPVAVRRRADTEPAADLDTDTDTDDQPRVTAPQPVPETGDRAAVSRWRRLVEEVGVSRPESDDRAPAADSGDSDDGRAAIVARRGHAREIPKRFPTTVRRMTRRTNTGANW